MGVTLFRGVAKEVQHFIVVHIMQALTNDFFHIRAVGLQQAYFAAQGQIFRIQAGDLRFKAGMLPLELAVFKKAGRPPDHAREQHKVHNRYNRKDEGTPEHYCNSRLGWGAGTESFSSARNVAVAFSRRSTSSSARAI